MEGGLRRGTSEEGTELCMDGARGRGEGGSERMREVEEQLREDRRSKGDREGGKLQGRYPGGHWPIYYIQCPKLHTTRPLPLRLWYYKLKIVSRYSIYTI